MSLSEDCKELCRRGDGLFTKKQPIDSFWQVVADQFYPERADFTSPHSWGKQFGADLFDSTPMLCRRDLGNAFSSMLRPRGQPWFKCIDPDEKLMEQPHIAAWYDHMTSRGRQLLYDSRARFVRATKEGDHDFAAFGNTVLSIEENRAKNGLLFHCHHLRDCAWAESGEGRVDTLFRKMKLTARQMRQLFGDDKLHTDVQNALKKEPDREFTVWHIAMPAEDYKGYDYKAWGKARRRRKGLDWASIYIDRDHEHELREAYTYEFRYVVPRWQTLSGSPYAVSPAVTVALADARGMQTMARVLLEAGEKSVDPPMTAVTEAIRGEINLYAGGITSIDRDYDEKTGAVLNPLVMGRYDANLGIQMLMRSMQTQKDAWYLSKLTLPQGAKTAYETAQLVEEYVRANIPLFEPMETEYNAAILDLSYSIMARVRAFDFSQMPDEIEGGQFDFSFSNPLQDAIERNRVNQATTVMGAIAGAMQVDPTVKEAVDLKQLVRDVTRGSGAPANWLVDEKQADAAIGGQKQAGDILAGLSGAEQAASVVNQGADATLKLQQAGLLPGGGTPQPQALQ